MKSPSHGASATFTGTRAWRPNSETARSSAGSPVALKTRQQSARSSKFGARGIWVHLPPWCSMVSNSLLREVEKTRTSAPVRSTISALRAAMVPPPATATVLPLHCIKMGSCSTFVASHSTIGAQRRTAGDGTPLRVNKTDPAFNNTDVPPSGGANLSPCQACFRSSDCTRPPRDRFADAHRVPRRSHAYSHPTPGFQPRQQAPACLRKRGSDPRCHLRARCGCR